MPNLKAKFNKLNTAVQYLNDNFDEIKNDIVITTSIYIRNYYSHNKHKIYRAINRIKF